MSTTLELQYLTLRPALALAGSEELDLLHQSTEVPLRFQVTVCEMGKNTHLLI